MSSERWQRLNEIFDAATALDPAERSAYLAEACGDDVELRTRATRLVAAHERAGDFIEKSTLAIGKLLPPEGEADDVAPGQRYGAYRVIREIARGGMGAVYLAERADGLYQRRVALKLVRRGLDVEPMLRRFQIERQILASLDHPNIARLLDGGTGEDGRPFFVMEYIEGEPIDAYVRARDLSIRDRLQLFLQVCDAVAYAHRHGIIHRDLKPANILVTAEGVPRLLDFGIAKAVVPDAPGTTSSVTGLRLLTPEYASPEQVEGLSATVASDVYSLGVILFELLTGTSPYRPRSRNPLDVADAVRTTTPQPPSAASPPSGRRLLRGDLDTVVLAALRKEPARRYASVDDLAADLRRHLDGQPIGARRDSLAYRSSKFLRRNRTAVLAAGVAILATSLVAAAVLFLRPAQAEPSLMQTGALAERDRIVVSQFTDQGGDSLLAAALTDAFRIDLGQSPHVRVLTPVQVSGALQRMQHPTAWIPNDSVARELAVREGAKAYVTGSLANVAGTYTLMVQLVGAENGEALAAVRETAADSTDLIPAVSRASQALRRRLGETLRELREMPALEQAATASLPALRKYTEGYRLFLQGDRTRAIQVLEQAAALDPAFAAAYAVISSAWSAMAEHGRSNQALQRALAHQDRLTFRDRSLLAARDAFERGDFPVAISEYNRLLERYPKDVAMLNNLALAHRYARQFAVAESLWHRTIALDSSINVLFYGLHSAQALGGRLDEARRTLEVVRRRFPADPLLPVVVVQHAAAEQNWAEAERLARINREHQQADTLNLVDAYEQLAGIAMTRGRLREAEQHWRTQLTLADASGSAGRRLFGAVQLAMLELRHYNRPARARAIVDSVLALQPLDSILPADRPYFMLARFYSGLGNVARARALLAAGERSDRATGRTQPAELAWTRGVIALAERKTRAAESALREAADLHSCAICPLPDLARAYDAAGKADLALKAYEDYMATPWLWRYENDAVELLFAWRRMKALYETRGDTSRAARAIENISGR